MNENKTIATWNVLRDFGFAVDSSVMSDAMPGLSYDFGNFKLSACSCMNLRFADVVLFTGCLASPRSISEVQFEIPQFVESRELCAAWIVWHLDGYADGRIFQPMREVAWLHEGRNYKHLLPWERERVNREREQEEYRARPHCTAQRDWLRLALKTLKEYLAKAEDVEPVEIGFDGKVLSFRLAGNVVVLAAEGSPWPTSFTLPAGKLRPLPKRLMSADIDVSVWRSRLNIDGSRYDGIVEVVCNSKQEKDA